MYQPRCGYPYEHECYARQASEMLAQEGGFDLFLARRLTRLSPQLLRDAGYGSSQTTSGYILPIFNAAAKTLKR